MRLDLREILDTPGARLPFEQELSADRLGFDSVEEYLEPIAAHGEIVNTAGAKLTVCSYSPGVCGVRCPRRRSAGRWR